MAKKRGFNNPTGGVPGGEDAIVDAAISKIQHLSKDLKSAIESSNQNTNAVLKEFFGLSSVGESKVWTLKSGKKVEFTPVTLSYEEVRDNTTVTFEVNGRFQDDLTLESLQDLNSILTQQYTPAIARLLDGKMDILDGSRRRARFLYEEGAIKEFHLLVSSEDISVSDAKALAKELQSAKEHSLRDIGLRCQLIKDNHFNETGETLNQTALAEQLGVSQSLISKALTAASVKKEMLTLFPDVNTLAIADYKLLKQVQDELESNNFLDGFIDEIETEIISIDDNLAADEYKIAVLTLIKNANKKLTAKPKDKAVTTKLFDCKGNQRTAKKTEKGRKVSYTFDKITEEAKREIEEAIVALLEKHNQ
ncbi:ParB family protein [Pseudoalteromonas sp. APC 3358]|uniref:ParB family protein n=1 Tax=unclassified Pseudoalteromonas TaxID=194690 RepID=UPI0004000133|nr:MULTISPECIES: ParB family protein [unclassified Pseudoalteromonas]MDN3384411.1 ParB family protein [Pseudoalteromonas sp. APC 3358]